MKLCTTIFAGLLVALSACGCAPRPEAALSAAQPPATADSFSLRNSYPPPVRG